MRMKDQTIHYAYNSIINITASVVQRNTASGTCGRTKWSLEWAQAGVQKVEKVSLKGPQETVTMSAWKKSGTHLTCHFSNPRCQKNHLTHYKRERWTAERTDKNANWNGQKFTKYEQWNKTQKTIQPGG